MKKTKADHQLINQDSGNQEMYTPPHIIEAVRKVLGTIDLDPASCEQANETVKATNYLSLRSEEYIGIKSLDLNWNFFAQPDPATVFMNHPYGRVENPLWTQKLIHEYAIGNVSQAISLVFAATSEAWFQPLLDYPVCFISGRVKHIDTNGNELGSSPKGSCLVYFGDNLGLFYSVMRDLGKVQVPYLGSTNLS
jgi:DNA N-6-adenine-methyltransferase Dam